MEQRESAIAEQLVAHGVATVLLQYADISGRIKGVSVPAARFAEVCTTGQVIDGSSLESVVRLRENDMVLRPDLSTFAILPWRDGAVPVARVICDVATLGGKPSPGDPRAVLRRTLALAADAGYHYTIAPEVEFFICMRDAHGRLRPLADDRDGYFDLDADPGAQLRHSIVAALEALGIAVTSSHHEVSPGQHEIDLVAADALAMADALVTLKFVARRLAAEAGLAVTFMPKPFNDASGSGMHLHQQLHSVTTAANLFATPGGHHAVAASALNFIAGQLHHAPALLAVTSPLVNSYKRLASGYEAPATIGWAHENRSAFIRVAGLATARASQADVEVRGSDPACNPYLASAVLLRAGMAGIQGNMEAPQPVEDYVYAFEERDRMPLGGAVLPLSLGEALAAFGASGLMRETLGEHVFGRYFEMKRREWRTFQAQVSDWEQTTSWDNA